MKTFPDPHVIEQELRAIQHDASPNEARTSLFNLVIFLGETQDSKVTEALNYLHGKRPARIIKVLRNQKGPTRADVTARCVTDHEDRGICIQEITILSGEDGAGEDPGAWGPLLIREIPVIVWWADALPDQGFPILFEEYQDRVLVDSSLFPSPLDFYLSQGDLSHLHLGDLTWSKVLPLMKLTAQIFNPLDFRPDLHSLKRIDMIGAKSCEASLYFLWIMNKMNWNEKQPLKELPWSLVGSDGQLIQMNHSSPKDLKLGFEVQFETTQGKIYKIIGSTEGFAQVQAPGVEDYKTILKFPSMGETLLREVDQTHGDRLFLDTITQKSF